MSTHLYFCFSAQMWKSKESIKHILKGVEVGNLNSRWSIVTKGATHVDFDACAARPAAITLNRLCLMLWHLCVLFNQCDFII